MGKYLNSRKSYTSYENLQAKPYFVDKSLLLAELFALVQSGESYICITRPRRFGKTSAANMTASFFVKDRESGTLFDHLKIAGHKGYRTYINQYNVIFITFNELPRECSTYSQYIGRIERYLTKDLKMAYPDFSFHEEDAVWDILDELFEEKGEQFIFVLDEWDYIFHQDFITEQDKKSYLRFLCSLLKDKPYVLLAYMTGILPISKYSSGSELNMFLEYTMVNEEKFNSSFGFSESEVDTLYKKYLLLNPEPKITREELSTWYDGYHTSSQKRVYNPRSVIASLTNNHLGNYWTSSGPYDEIYYYIEKNVDAVRNDLARMAAGIPVPVNVQEYAATSMKLSTKDEIFSAMVVYGFLSYDNGFVRIPNKELMDKFADMLKKEASLGYLHRLAAESDRMLRATKSGDTKTMLQILEYAHDTEIPLLSYNSEADLSAVVNLIYLSARDSYRVEREDKAGTGYADFLFYPVLDKGDDCIILELKVDSTPDEAIRQIKEKKYALSFSPKLGKAPAYTGRILAVGISYDKKEKKHNCKVVTLRT